MSNILRNLDYIGSIVHQKVDHMPVKDMTNHSYNTTPTTLMETNGSAYNYSEYMDYIDYPRLMSFVEFLDKYYIPLLIILGVIGNIVCLVVFTCSPLKRLSLSVYLAALAVTDSLFLISLGVGWLDNPGVRLFHKNGWCQITVYTSYVCCFLSVWFVVSYTIERYIAICHPLKRPEMCTTSKARLVVSFLCILALSMYACSLRMSGVTDDPYSDDLMCAPFLTEQYYKVYLILTYWDSFITFLLPFMVILCFNSRIFYKIAWMHKRHSDHVPIASLQHCPEHCHRHPNMTEICHHGQGQIKVTKLLLIISTVFLGVSLPSYVARVRAFVLNLVEEEASSSVLDMLLQHLCQYLFYSNYSINIILYLICWRKFRKILNGYCRHCLGVIIKTLTSCKLNLSRKTSSIRSSFRTKLRTTEETDIDYI